ncbi:MAG: hypothetical protein AAB343_03915 [Patescibacteria group bacterium]
MALRVHSTAIPRDTTAGQTIMIITVLFLVGLMAIVTGFATIGVTQARISRDSLSSNRSFFATEAVLEDIALRKKTILADPVAGDYAVDTAYPIPLNYLSGATQYSISPKLKIIPATTDIDKDRIVVSSAAGDAVRRSQFLFAPLVSGSVSFSEDLQAGNYGVLLRQSAAVRGNMFSNSHIRGSGTQGNKLQVIKDPDRTSEFYVRLAKARPDVPNTTAQNENTSAGAIAFRDHANEDNLAQQFVVDEGGYLDKVAIKIARCAFISSGTDITVKIAENSTGQGGYGGNGNVPDHFTVLGTKTLTLGSVANDPDCSVQNYSSAAATAWVSVDFSDLFLPLQTGKPYWLVLNSSCGAGSCGKYFLIDSTSNNAYNPTTEVDAEFSEWVNFQTLYNSADNSYAWCVPVPTPAACTRENNPNPTAARDIQFKIYIGTASPRIDNLVVEKDGAPGVCDTDITAEAEIINNIDTWVQGKADIASNNSTNGSCYVDDGVYGNGYDRKSTPVTDQWIADVKTAAGANCTVSTTPSACLSNGNFEVNGADKSIGAKFPNNQGVINGDLKVLSGNTLSIRNFLYVKGDLEFNGGEGCLIKIDSSGNSHFGTEQTAFIIVDGTVSVKGQCIVQGRDNEETSHLVIVSLSNSIDELAPAAHLQQQASGDIYHAPNGLVKINNTGNLHTVYGAWIIMENNTTVTSLAEGFGELKFGDTGVPQVGSEALPTQWGEAQ